MNLNRWIAKKITEILKDEDDVVVETCYNLLESSRYVRLTFSPRPAFAC